MKYFLKILLLIPLSNNVFSAYYDTVPAGRRALVYKNVVTSTIDSGYGSSSKVKNYSFQQAVNLKTISSLSPDLQGALSVVQSSRPDIYNNLRLAEFAANIEANLRVQAFGLAWGISDRMMVYAGLPIYTAKVTTNVRRTKGNNYNTALANPNIQIDPNTSIALQQIEDLSGEFLQSVAVNELNYKPLGDWEAKDFGDLEIGVLYRLTDWDRAGIAVSGGVVAPTGRIDDPDLLQDVIAFGDGQWDLFAEVGGGFKFKKTPLSFDTYVRYTLQLPTTKVIRAPLTSDFTALGDHKITVYEKLGNKIDFRAMLSYDFSDLFSISTGYEMNIKNSNSYESLDATANEIQMLEANSTSIIHYAKMVLSITTIKAFLAKKFLLPLKFDLSGQTSISGTNSAKVNRYEATLTMFF